MSFQLSLPGNDSDRLLARPGRPNPGYVVISALVITITVAGLVLLGTTTAKYALAGALAILCLGLFATDPAILAFLAIPATLVVARVSGSSVNLSVSDLVLFLGAMSGLFALKIKEAPELRPMFLLVAIYEALLVPTLIENPYRADFIEWGHEVYLVAGSLIVGWVVARRGWTKQVCATFLFGAAIISGYACFEDAVRFHFHDFGGLSLQMQKNYIGNILANALLVAWINPPWIGLRKRYTRPLIILLSLGILASHSRQAMVSLAIVGIIIIVRDKSLRRRSKIILLSVIPLGIVAYLTLQKELASHNRFDSINTRLDWYRTSIHLWETSPWFGIGLRWWYLPQYAATAFQPPNGEMEMLSSAGILGLLGFVIAMSGYARLSWKLPGSFGTLAFAAILYKLVDGQIDIFWVTATGAIPWMLCGLSMGALAAARAGTLSPSFLSGSQPHREQESDPPSIRARIAPAG